MRLIMNMPHFLQKIKLSANTYSYKIKSLPMHSFLFLSKSPINSNFYCKWEGDANSIIFNVAA